MIRNPVLPGFHPDPSITRAEGRYVIATSTFEWFPGVRFHTSNDLVTWTLAGHALTHPEQLDMRGIPDSGGIWAPSLYWRDGTYTLVFTVVRTMSGKSKDLDNYITTAPALEGPWTAPVYVGSRGFDASLFTAPDGKLYLVGLRWDHRTDQPSFGGIQIQELNPETFALIGNPALIHTSAHPEVSAGLIEGPNLYFRDGWYYLLLAEGGTGWNHGIRVARAKDLWGPYTEDPKPLLTTRDLDPLAVAKEGLSGPSQGFHKAGHGELIETDDGEWYLVHLASRPVVAAEGAVCVPGRETCLQKVNWTDDGWLRLAHAGHLPVATVPAPAHYTGTPDRLTEDSSPAKTRLTAGSLGNDWVTLREPADESWAVWKKNGHGAPKLQLTGRDSLNSPFRQSHIAHRLTGTSGRLRATIHAHPVEPFHRAGVTAYYDTTSHIFWYLTTDDHGRRVLAMERRDAHGESDTILDISPEAEGPVHLEVNYDGALVRARASLDGEGWIPLGDDVDASSLSDDHAGLLRFTGAFAGIAVSDLAEHRWSAEFTNVSYHHVPHEERE